VQYAMQIILLFVFKNYYFYVIVLPIFTIFNNFVCAYWAKKMFPQYVCRGKISQEMMGGIKKNIKGLFFQKIGWIVLTSSDNIIISTFLGLKLVAMYNNYYCIISALVGVLAVINNSIKPSVGNSLISEPLEKNAADLRKFNFMYLWLISICCVCLVVLFQPFMTIWMGKSLLLPFNFVILLTLQFYVYKNCDILYVYQESAGKWWSARFVPMIAAIVNLSANIFLVRHIGINGVVISTIISFVFVYNIGYMKIVFGEVFHSFKEGKHFFLIHACFLIVTIFNCALVYFICSFIHVSGIIGLILKLVICLVIPNVIMLIVYCKSPEFKMSMIFVKNLVGKVFKRSKS
ncbi:MAG: hypothetical protein K2F81_04625, partial [Ruminococcus sp.]|nr:hypothetical protein [Ruminococcus sp.]